MCPGDGSSHHRLTVCNQDRVRRSGLEEKSFASRSNPSMAVMSQGAYGRNLFLKRSCDIEYAKQHGHRVSTALFNVVICRTEMNVSRVGIVVGKRLGGAVSRNRVKRLFRELTRQLCGRLLPGHDLVVFPKRDSILQPFTVLKEVWVSTLQRQRLLRFYED